MKIYVVMFGERYEGGHICDIFSTESEAIKFANEYAKTMSFTMVKDPENNNWVGGCDWLSVEEWGVSSSAEEALEEINN
jgi:hypothetical protein